MIGRRSFLKALGIGAASAPIAAKAMAEQEIASLTRLRGHGVPPLAANFGVGMPATSSWSIDTNVGKMSAWVRMFGLPTHIERKIRDNSRHVQALDPDIACKKSWSLNVKIQAQRERNYREQVEHYATRDKWQKAQEEFTKLTGLHWYW